MGKINSEEKLICLIENYKNLIFSVCLKITSDYFVAEDMTQETFLSAYSYIKENQITNEKTFLCRIATNKCIDYLRRAETKNARPTDDDLLLSIEDNLSDPVFKVLEDDILNRLNVACSSLKEPYKSIATEHYIKGKSSTEIAKECGKNIHTIKTNIFRAKQMLKNLLREELYDI